MISKDDIDKVICTLKAHQVVAFPTETVYGLGVIYHSHEALERLVYVKKREKNKSITLMLPSIEMISRFAYITPRDLKIIHAFMPGRITIILKKRKEIDDIMTFGKETIGIRIPNDEFVLTLLKNVGPMFVTSANISGNKDATTTSEVLKQLAGRIPVIVDGKSGDNKPSTVVDLTGANIQIVREGEISYSMIEEVVK